MTDQPTLFDHLPELTRAELLAQQGVPPVPMNLTINPTRLVRTQDPDTSRQAAESASRRGPTQRRQVWEALKKLGGATDYEISVECGILRSSAAKRRQELQDLGYVIETHYRRKTDTGTEAIVWRCSYVSDYSGS